MQYYYLAKILNNFPKLFLFLQGFWGALVLFFFYKILDLLISEEENKQTIITGSLLAVCTSYLFIYEIGTALMDLQICFIPLAAIYILLKEIFNKMPNLKTVAISGLLFGMATGFKLTMGMYAIAMFIALLFYIKKLNNPFKILSAFLAGGIFGFILTGGYWCYFLFKKFGNPFFPFYGNFFHSEFSEPLVYYNNHHIPKNLTEWLAFPYFFYDNNHARVFEAVFRDYRWTIGYTIFMLYCFNICGFKTKFKEKLNNIIDTDKLNILMLFMGISYVIWIGHFCIIRYMALVEIFLSFIVVLFLYFLCSLCNIKKIFSILLACLLMFLYSTTIKTVMRIEPDNFVFDVQDMKIPDNSVVVSCGMPTSFVSVFQTQKVKNIYGFTDFGYPYIPSKKAINMLRKILEENENRIYALWAPDGQTKYPDGYKDKPYIFQDDYDIDYNSCKSIYNNYKEMIGLCKVHKTTKNSV